MSDTSLSLNTNDYQPLSDLDRWLSNFGLFGLLNKRRKLVVEDHAFKCWFALTTTRPQYLNVKIASDADGIVREAMSARIRYFNWRGQEIDGAHQFTRGRRGSRKRLSFFFADPVDNVKRQRLWLRPPHGARFVMLTFERSSYDGWLGFSTKVKLKRLKPISGKIDRQTQFEKLLKSRDRMRMTWFLRELKVDARLYNRDQVKSHNDPIEMARVMLGQMVYLWHGVEEKRVQMIIDDALHLSKYGFDLGRTNVRALDTLPTEAAQDSAFDYEAPLNEDWRVSGVLSKQMRMEAMILSQHLSAVEAGTLIIRSGKYYMARLLIGLAVQRLTGINLIVDVQETLSSRLHLGEWLHWRDFKAWLDADETGVEFTPSVKFMVKDLQQSRALSSCGIDAKSIIEAHTL